VKVSSLCLSLPALTIPLCWHLLWTPLAAGNTEDKYAEIDAQRYFHGYAANAFDFGQPVQTYCYSWNDCLHNYLYSFFHTYLGSAVWFNFLLYLLLTYNMISLLHLSFPFSKIPAFTDTRLFYACLLLNPFVYVYACLPAKELISIVLLSSALVCSLWSKSIYAGLSTLSLSNRTIFFVTSLLLLVAILIISFFYRFQLLPIALCLLVFFPLRKRIKLSTKLTFKLSAALRFLLILIAAFLLLLAFNLLGTFSLLHNILYFFAPFNFPFPVNPGFISLFNSHDFNAVFFVGGFTQLSGFLLSIVFLLTLRWSACSYSSLLLILLACSIGLLYGPTSTRYAMTVGYFALASLLLDLVRKFNHERFLTVRPVGPCIST
jgi:hypothetical protein